MKSHEKIVHGDYAYYVSTVVFETQYMNDAFAFASNGHRRMAEMSDCVVHRPTQNLVKNRYVGEMIIDRLLGIYEVPTLIQKFSTNEAH